MQQFPATKAVSNILSCILPCRDEAGVNTPFVCYASHSPSQHHLFQSESGLRHLHGHTQNMSLQCTTAVHNSPFDQLLVGPFPAM